MSGDIVTSFNNIRVRVNAEGIIDPMGEHIAHIMYAKVKVGEDYIWDGFCSCGTGGSPLTPTYAAPTLSISAAPVTAEAGTVANVAVTPVWSQKDAGAPTSYQAALTGAPSFTSASPVNNTFSSVLFEDTAKLIKSTVGYAAGPIKNDSLGVPYPTGAITAGTIDSNTVSLIGYRKAFWACFSSNTATPTVSAGVRALANQVNDIGSVKKFTINIPNGTYDVIFGFPASVGSSVYVEQVSFPLGNLVIAYTQSTVLVEGANGYTAVPYSIFHMSNAAPYTADQHIVTIS